MADTRNLPSFSRFELPEQMTQSDVKANRFTEAALERHKREGMELAVRARWIMLLVIAIMLPLLNPSFDVIYHLFLLGLMAFVGLLARRFAKVGISRMELAVLFLDLSIVTFALVFPNPFGPDNRPHAMIYQYESFQYFYVILAAGTMAYAWKTIIAIGCKSVANLCFR